MTRQQVLVTLIGVGCTTLGAAAALALVPQTGTPDLRMGVVLAAAPAKAVPCGTHPGAGCFRMFMEARGTDTRPHRISLTFENANYFLENSFAYLEDGGVCRVYVPTTVAQTIHWSNNSYSLPQSPETVSAERPLSFPAEFRCDQPVRVGEKARVQISIAVGNGDFSQNYSHQIESAVMVHFNWPEVEIGANVAR